MDPSSPKGQALLAMHFIAQSAPDFRGTIQKATAGPQAPMKDLFQLAYLVFSNRDMVEKAECTQRNMQKAHDGNGFDTSETNKGETKSSKEKLTCIFEMQMSYLVFSGTLISAILLKCKF